VKIYRLNKGAAAFLIAAALFTVPFCASAKACAARPSTAAHCHHGQYKCYEMNLLSKISGKSVEELVRSYPQKTVWQAAKELGKLEELKTAYLAHAHTGIDRLVLEKRISAQDGQRFYVDLQKRVGAIDGVNIVIVGRPGFIPEFHKDNRQ
jgi:hypothetical protein